MDTSFRPLIAKRYSAHVAPIGPVALPSIGGTTTTTIYLAGSRWTYWFNEGWLFEQTLGVYAGTATVQFFRYDFVNSAAIALTAAKDVTSTGQTANKTLNVPALTTLTDIQRTIMGSLGDSLYASFVTSAGVTDQPVGGIIGAEVFVLH